MLRYVSNTEILQDFTGLVNTTHAVDGQLVFNGVKVSGMTGNFNVLEITFEVVGAGGSLTALDLAYTALANTVMFADLLPILTVNDGQINVNSR